MNTMFSRPDYPQGLLPKVLGLAVIGFAGYLIYNQFVAPDTVPAALLAASKAPSALPPSSIPGMIPVAYTGKVRSGGATSYLVTTSTDPLNIRSGPGTSYAKIGEFDRTSTILATGNLVDAAGMTWAEVKTPDNNLGWASTTYLTATPQAQIASALSGIQNAMGLSAWA